MILMWCIWWFPVILSLSLWSFPLFCFQISSFMLEDLDWLIFRFTDSFTSQLKYTWLAPLLDFLFQIPYFSILESLLWLLTADHLPLLSLSVPWVFTLVILECLVLLSLCSFNTSAVFKPLVNLGSGLLCGFCRFCSLNISH